MKQHANHFSDKNIYFSQSSDRIMLEEKIEREDEKIIACHMEHAVIGINF